MKIFITGGTGFVGTFLAEQMILKGYKVTIIAFPGERRLDLKGLTYITGNPAEKGSWQKSVPEQDVIVNLAGAPIFTRWTLKQKEIILSSRIRTTQNIVEAMPVKSRHITLISTSAVGYYGFRNDEKLNETSDAGDDFLAYVAKSWEHEAMQAERKKARVIITRFGIVLGKNGGALGLMIPLFKYFLGGPLGSGHQWFSWIHMNDLCSAFMFLLEKKNIAGSFNLCSPNPVRNKELARTLGKILHRPSFLSAPGFAIKTILGEFGSVLVEGQRAVPERLLENKFEFKYPLIKDALEDILKN
jgi:uncharacterized protein